MAQARDFRERLTGERLKLVAFESDQQDVVGGSRRSKQIVIRGAGEHLLLHAGARGWMLQALAPLLEAAFLHPRRHGAVEAGSSGWIGVHVGGDFEAGGVGRVYALENLGEVGPVLGSGDLEVIDLGGKLGFAGDGDEFVNGFEFVVALVADMRDVDAFVLRGF